MNLFLQNISLFIIKMKTQSGLSLIATILALLIFSLFIAVAVSLVTTGAHIGVQETQGQQAFDIAEGGLEKTLNYIIKQKDAACTTSETCACSPDAAAYANTNPSLGAGSFNVATTATHVTNPPTTLSGDINATVTNISVSSTAVYAASGRIMIDREVIEYTSLTATSFDGCKRGVAGTVATAHYGPPVVTRVGQKQCAITSTGTISTNPLVSSIQRRVSTVAELQEGWVVGGVALPTDNLRSVHCTDANNCWAVGDNGTIARWNGTSWTLHPDSGVITTENLRSVYMISTTDGWAVGDNGTILRWNTPVPNTWNIIASPTTENLNSVFMVSADDGWAVGDNGTILRWNTPVPNTWNIVASPTTENLNSVFMVSADDGWAVGDNGTILRWNTPVPNTWNIVASPTTENLNSVFMVSADDGWAVGDPGGATQKPLLIRWTGATSTWSTYNSSALNINQPLNSVYCTAWNNCWAVGDPDNALNERPLILFWDGNSWTRKNSDLNINETLNSVFMVLTNNGWAVGDNGRIFRWDGTSWSLWTQANATALRWNSASWSDRSGLLPTGTNELRSVSMLSYVDGWAVGNRRGCANPGLTILRWNGASWACPAGLPVVDQNLNSVYMISSTEGWAVGNRRGCANPGLTILRWNGASWACPAGLPVVDQNLNSVYMISSTDGWAVGNRTGATTNGWVFLRWNNPTASTWNLYSVDTTPTIAQNLNSVYMVSANDGWAVGNRTGATTNGWVFLRWNVTSWSQVAVDTSPTIAQNLNSVFMLDTNGDGIADDGWAVGNRLNLGGGVFRFTILRWNGVSWSALVSPQIPADAANNQNLNSVYCISNNECWAVGNSGVILSWNGSNWSRVTSPTGADLNELYIIGTSAPKGQWREIFP